jgi:FkbM family methyltransferase
MKMRVWSWLRRYVVTGRLTIPYFANGWITVNEEDLIQREVLTHGAYEPEVWRHLMAFSSENDVVWDVGANIGTVTIQASLDARVRVVHSFEPDPNTFELLKTNVELNRPERCQLHACALSDVEEERVLVCGPTANRGLSTMAHTRANGEMVRCVTADSLVFQRGLPAPTLIKIDVEGWESRVLAGATRLLAERPPRALIFEAPANDNCDLEERDIEARLSEHGYRIEHIPRVSGIVEKRENYLAVHRTA